jgi:hypothetical protein
LSNVRSWHIFAPPVPSDAPEDEDEVAEVDDETDVVISQDEPPPDEELDPLQGPQSSCFPQPSSSIPHT